MRCEWETKKRKRKRKFNEWNPFRHDTKWNEIKKINEWIYRGKIIIKILALHRHTRSIEKECERYGGRERERGSVNEPKRKKETSLQSQPNFWVFGFSRSGNLFLPIFSYFISFRLIYHWLLFAALFFDSIFSEVALWTFSAVSKHFPLNCNKFEVLFRASIHLSFRGWLISNTYIVVDLLQQSNLFDNNFT